MPEPNSAVCLVIDRLSAAYVGPLGNTWIYTPAFDRLAVQSLVFDRAITDSPAVEDVYRSLWTGTPAWSRGPLAVEAKQPALAECFRQGALPTVLVTDDDALAAHPLAAAFDEVIHIPHPAQRGQADDWQTTQLATFFAAAAELLGQRRPPALVWLHTCALGRVWDSPQELRDQYGGEDEPPAPAIVEPPSQLLADDADPDELLGLRHAYAGEITVLDHCLSALVATIGQSAWADALLAVTSARGYPLGEHGIVGSAGEALYGELLQVPCFVRSPGVPRYGARSQALVQPADLCATLRQWLAPNDSETEAQPRAPFSGRSLLARDDESWPSRKIAFARTVTGETALVTPAWFVRARPRGENAECVSTDGSTEATRILELYVKPDDYFEANEISDRCRDVADEFQEIVQALDHTVEQNALPDFNMSDAVIHGVEAQHAR